MGVLQGRVAFITGAAQGIGLQLAKDFAREGAVVAIADMNGTAAKAAAAELGGSGVACDVTSEAQLVGALDQVIGRHGRIDVLVNNAGLQFVSSIEEFPAEKFELLIRVMLIAPFLAMKHVFPLMKRQRSGRIINMASINGLVGFAGKAAYNSAKHGLIGLTRVAALEGAAHGITVNALCPGYVDTPLVRNQLGDLARTRGVPVEKVIEEVIFPLVPMKKLLSVADVSEYALFLASDKAGGITGQAVVVDAGYTAQ
ncbi:MAG TPA: 3-hydroxybutyrate dehydrogenase [Anaeromyxobacteraceae bacterium]|nr:3-hydroxybutyrate dehydrogenase [Anaeromyxobacteraceae bacterium]